MTALLWLRNDLRRRDHPALAAAASDGDHQVAVLHLLDVDVLADRGPGVRAWWARTLQKTNEAYDQRLILRLGDPAEVVLALVDELGASSVHVSTDTTPAGTERDRLIAAQLADAGVQWSETGSGYAVTPGRVLNQGGKGYKVFTPFARAWQEHGWRQPAEESTSVDFVDRQSDGEAWRLVEQWATSEAVPDLPEAGEEGALRAWRHFCDEDLDSYDEHRDRPDLPGTSRMSPYLALGVVHPRTLLADIDQRAGAGAHRYRLELGWREFYADVLFHQPHSAWADLNPALSELAYDEDAHLIDGWRRGMTGFPIVDAGMRQLLHTGWMHNRVRMIVASFLCKDLHTWWPLGARHFLEHLIDGDLASNNHGWQWVAGTGTDAAPYFRVFNPILQGEKFDPAGDYVRAWVPELRHVPGAAVHTPWKRDDGHAHGYPQRIVDHAEERKVALARYQLGRN